MLLKSIKKLIECTKIIFSRDNLQQLIKKTDSPTSS